MHKSLGKILALYVLGFCSFKFCRILSLMLQSDNPLEYIIPLWLILGVVFIVLCLLMGNNTMVAITKNGFKVLLLTGLYFALIKMVTNYICAPIFGELMSGVVALGFVLLPVVVYELKKSTT